MVTKSARVIELEEGIARAVATLDVSDASRIGLQEAFDSARETLADAYGVGFEKAVNEEVELSETDEGDDDDDGDGIADEDED